MKRLTFAAWVSLHLAVVVRRARIAIAVDQLERARAAALVQFPSGGDR